MAQLAAATGIPVAETQAGKGSLRYDHPASLGALGATGTAAANGVARDADVVIGVGTRWSDFTTASHSVFANPDVRVVNINVTPMDTTKLVRRADRRRRARRPRARCTIDWRGGGSPRTSRASTATPRPGGTRPSRTPTRSGTQPLPAQGEVIGAVEASTSDRDVVVAAAGSLPGDLHKLWRTRDPKGYHVEYAFSCMGYEIAAGLGVKMADPTREVYVMVGDGSYLMLSSELVTAVQEGIKVIVVLVVNHGFQSIGALSESVGVERFGTKYRYRDASGQLAGAVLPVDLAANAESLGATVLRAGSVAELTAALAQARGQRFDDGDLRRDRPVGRRPGLRVVVGRARRRGRRAREHARRARTLRRRARRPASVPAAHDTAHHRAVVTRRVPRVANP